MPNTLSAKICLEVRKVGSKICVLILPSDKLNKQFCKNAEPENYRR